MDKKKRKAISRSVDKQLTNLNTNYIDKKTIHAQREEDKKENNNKKKDTHKSPLPDFNNDKGIVLPKINHNYLYENIKLISDNKVPKKYKKKEDNKQFFHKNYGKTPEYLSQFKEEEKMKKEYMKYLKEQRNCPKGTRMVAEEERQDTLKKLFKTKRELENILEKFPITQRSMSVQNKKEEILRKMDEIDKGIELFSKKRVFVEV